MTFATLRPYEFIRNGAILHQLPVRIVGIGGGFEYGPAGPSHHGIEDVGVMRIHPGMTVIAPADALQTRTALLATRDMPGPIYYRLGKDDKTITPGLDGRFELGRAQIIREGADLLIVTMGSIAVEAVAAAEALALRGIASTVMVVASFNPSPVDDLAAALARFPLVLSAEAHYPVGGVGSFVADVIAEQGLHCRLVRCAVTQTPSGMTGSQQYHYRINGLSSDCLVETALRALGEEPL